MPMGDIFLNPYLPFRALLNCYLCATSQLLAPMDGSSLNPYLPSRTLFNCYLCHIPAPHSNGCRPICPVQPLLALPLPQMSSSVQQVLYATSQLLAPMDGSVIPSASLIRLTKRNLYAQFYPPRTTRQPRGPSQLGRKCITAHELMRTPVQEFDVHAHSHIRTSALRRTCLRLFSLNLTIATLLGK